MCVSVCLCVCTYICMSLALSLSARIKSSPAPSSFGQPLYQEFFATDESCSKPGCLPPESTHSVWVFSGNTLWQLMRDLLYIKQVLSHPTPFSAP